MNRMKLSIGGVLVCMVFFSMNLAIDIRGAFYAAFSSENVEKIDAALNVVSNVDESLAQAYRGALLMRKADLIKKGPGEKLKIFREGHEQLENQINAQPNNVELRFIRLCIQENAPKIVRYNGQIEEDKAMVIEKFSTLPSEVREFIADYAKTSEVLSPDELK